jgi:two-component system, NarL family, response regulator DevR
MDTSIASQTPGRKALRVFLVEDSVAIRERLHELVESIEGVVDVGHAGDASEAISAILATMPDAVVLDIRLSQGSGFDVLRAIHESAPAVTVYMLSNHATLPYRRLAQRLGAAEFFDKSTELERVRLVLAERARTLN